MTTPGAMWIAFGNPTQNTGRFRECFRRFRHRWVQRQVDSRTAKKADRRKIEQWIEDYGEDSDFVRIRVRGVFPRAGSNQLIPSDLVERALKRELELAEYEHAAIVVSTDVARYGDDQSVVLVRQGRKIHYARWYRELSTVEALGAAWDAVGTAHRTIEAIQWVRDELEREVDGIFVDAVGIGAGVVDALEAMGYDLIEVNAGERAMDPQKFFNRRAEMWWDILEWLKKGGSLRLDGPAHNDPHTTEITDDLTGPLYGYSMESKIQLEKKEDMKDRGLPSPDFGDALAHSFYLEVESSFMANSLQEKIKSTLAQQLQGQGTSHMSR